MPQENRQLHAVEESPVHRARARLASTLERIEAAVEKRVADAVAAQTPAIDPEAAEEAARWQASCTALEQEKARLEGALAESERLLKDVRAVTRKAEEKLARVMGEIEKILED